MISKSNNKFIKFLVENFWIWPCCIIIVWYLNLIGIDLNKFVVIPFIIINVMFQLIALLNAKFLSKNEKKEMMDERYEKIVDKASRKSILILDEIIFFLSIILLENEFTTVALTLIGVSLLHFIVFGICKTIYREKI